MKDCICCREKGVIYCNTRSLDNPNLTNKQLREMLLDIRNTQREGGKL